MSCSSSSSIASSSFRPGRSSTLRPLSSAGLCDAETMIPAAKSPVPARNASAGVGTHAGEVDVGAEARRAGRDRGHEHVARAARVLADDERAARAGELVRRRPAEGVGERRLQVDVGDAADPVRAEEARHATAIGRGRRRWRPARVIGRRVDGRRGPERRRATGRPDRLRRRASTGRGRPGARARRPRATPSVNVAGVEPVEVGDRTADRGERVRRSERLVVARPVCRPTSTMPASKSRVAVDRPERDGDPDRRCRRRPRHPSGRSRPTSLTTSCVAPLIETARCRPPTGRGLVGVALDGDDERIDGDRARSRSRRPACR